MKCITISCKKLWVFVIAVNEHMDVSTFSLPTFLPYIFPTFSQPIHPPYVHLLLHHFPSPLLPPTLPTAFLIPLLTKVLHLNPQDEYDWTDYPLYHTTYEDFDAIKNILDPEFRYHLSIGHLWALMGIGLADAKVIGELWFLDFKILGNERQLWTPWE